MTRLDDFLEGDADATLCDVVFGHDPGYVFNTYALCSNLNRNHGMDVDEAWVEDRCRQWTEEGLLTAAGGGVYCVPASRP